MDEPSYRVISVSLPKQPDRSAEELNLPSPYYRQHSLANAAQSQDSITTDQKLARQDKQEACISLDPGVEATTQTEDTQPAEPPDKAENIDENPSEKAYEQRLNALSNELAEIRKLFESI